MARRLNRGEIWLLEFPRPDKRRPVLILSNDRLIDALNTVTIATITTAMRGSPTEVTIGIEEGLKQTSCVNLVNLQTVEKHRLENFIGTVPPEKMTAVCRALNIATGCY